MSIPMVITKLLNKGGAYTGNAVTSLQLSTFIRPVDQTECNGFYFEPGYLRNKDLETFATYPRALAYFKRTTLSQRYVAYLWRRAAAKNHIVIYGATVATDDGLIKFSYVFQSSTRAFEIVKALEDAAGLHR